MTGKMNNARELSTKTVASAKPICSSLALIAGATAAIALPPHIAVPDEMRYAVVVSSLITLAMSEPITSVPTIVAIISPIPSDVTDNACSKLIPNPKPIIE